MMVEIVGSYLPTRKNRKSQTKVTVLLQAIGPLHHEHPKLETKLPVRIKHVNDVIGISELRLEMAEGRIQNGFRDHLLQSDVQLLEGDLSLLGGG